MPKTYLFLFIAAVLAGCASAPPVDEQVAGSNDKNVVCVREDQLGSMFAKTKCRSAQQIEAERANAATLGDNVRAQSPTPTGAGATGSK